MKICSLAPVVLLPLWFVSCATSTAPIVDVAVSKPSTVDQKIRERILHLAKPRLSRAFNDRDDDRDGIPDEYEDHLLQKFAPKIWLFGSENKWPVNIDWFLSRVTMRYSHTHCHDCEIIPAKGVTSANITEQVHQNKSGLFCHHKGPQNRSDGYTADPKNSFFLQFPDDKDHEGSTNRRDWQLYGHVYRKRDGNIVIQYWQLYAYNDSLGWSNHEADWEMSGVVVDENEKPVSVIHYRHGEAKPTEVKDAEWEGDHHVTYSAKGGHGQYPAFRKIFDPDGIANGSKCWPQQFPQELSDYCERGIAWDSWTPDFGGIVNVGERYAPLNGSNWLRYSGLWGEIGESAALGINFTSGPPGPAYQRDWSWGQ